MLFDTLKKKNRAEAEEQAWNANRPADYVSRNKDAMDAVTGQVGSGFDWDTADTAYQQYRNQGTANAQAAAQNAAANAAALAGGYGSSYADSVAKQGQQQALAAIDNAVPGLQSKALSQYQSGQNDLLSALSGMANTEALDRSAYGANLSNYEYWQNFLANQSQQARTENDNFWNNIWNGILNAGNVVKTAYDGYMGYTQQQWENDFAREQWEYNKNRTDQSDALNAYQQAFNLYTQGAGDASADVLNRYGLNADAFANYTGAPVTRDDQANVLTTAASLVASGNSEAAANLLKMYGMDANAAGDYNTLTQRALSAALAKSAATSSGSSGRSSSGGSSGSSGGWSNSEIRNLKKDRDAVAAKGGDTSWYDDILAANGYPVSEQSSTDYNVKVTSPNVLSMTDPAARYGGSNESKSLTLEAIANNRKSGALMAAQAGKSKGHDEQKIYNDLRNQGYSDDEIYYAMNRMK